MTHQSNTIPPHGINSLIENLTTVEKDTTKKLAPDGDNGVEWVEGGDLADFVDYNTSLDNPPYKEGRVFYDKERNALSYYNDESETTVNIAQEQIVKVCNDSGVTISNGDAVRVISSDSGLPCVIKSIADSSINAQVAGVATHDIVDGDTGYITTFGSVGDVDTSSFTEGDLLFLSSSVAGELVNAEQAILNTVGIVLTVGVTGSIFVKPSGVQNITAIGQVLGNNKVQVLTTTPQSVLAYNNTSNFNLNTVIIQTGSDPYTAQILPATVGTSGFYRVSFTFAIQATANTIHNFELYIDGSLSGLLGKVDLSNNNIDTGSTSMSVITKNIISETDEVEVFCYVDSGTSTVTYESAVLNIERIGAN